MYLIKQLQTHNGVISDPNFPSDTETVYLHKCKVLITTQHTYLYNFNLLAVFAPHLGWQTNCSVIDWHLFTNHKLLISMCTTATSGINPDSLRQLFANGSFSLSCHVTHASSLSSSSTMSPCAKHSFALSFQAKNSSVLLILHIAEHSYTSDRSNFVDSVFSARR